MNKDKAERFAHSVIAIFGIILGVYLFSRYLFMALLPFLIAWTVAFSVRPLASRLANLTKLPRRAVSAIIGTVSVLCILTLIIGVLVYAVGEGWDFISELKENNGILEILKKILGFFENVFGEIEDGEKLKEQIGSAVSEALSAALGSVVTFFTAFISSIPRVVLFIVITSIATVYFCLDLEVINETIKGVLSENAAKKLIDFKNRFLVTLVKYIRSYLFLMLITFLVMIFGFLIMKIPFAILLAFIVAVLDALPLIGVGTVLIPWGIFEILFGSLSRGIGLLILFAVSYLIRQFVEPRIVGKSLGIHPIISLVLLYFGYSFFGVLGLLAVPLITVIVKIVYEGFKQKE